MPDRDAIIRRGYLPKELPTPFNSRTLADVVVAKGLVAFASTAWLHPVRHNLARPGRMYRRLGIPHPVHFVPLADAVSVNWSSIQALMAKSDYSLSTAIDGSSDSRAIVPRFSKSVRVARRATAPAGARYVVRADVSQFYPSVYTHALDWAFTSKVAAKLAVKAKTSSGPGSRIDQLVALAQDGQTMGIPIGPDTSFALGELIMSRVDADVRMNLPPALRSFVRGTRFYDDYELFAPDESGARRVAAELENALANWELTLNPYKFDVARLPRQLDEEWIATLKQIGVPDDNSSSQRAALITLFSEAFRLRQLFPADNVLAYAIGQFVAANFVEKKVVFKENWAEFEGLLLQSAGAEPATLPRVTHLLAWYDERGYPVSRDAITRALRTIITEEGVRAHGSEVAWALWAAFLLDIRLGASVGRTVSRMSDDVVALVALHSRSLGLLSGLDTSKWSKHMNRPGLYGEHWLLAYEALHHSWLPSTTGRDYTKGDPFFGHLRRNGVCFYDETSAIHAPPIVRNVFAPGHIGILTAEEMVKTHRAAVESIVGDVESVARERPLEQVVIDLDGGYE